MKHFSLKIGMVFMVVAAMFFFVRMDNVCAQNKGELECGGGEYNPEEKEFDLPNKEPCWEDSRVRLRGAYIRVDICSPLEKGWRNRYSNYYYEANRVVERIDDYLSKKFGIDFYTVSQPNWDSNNLSNSETAVYSAKNQVGKGNADIMLAFALDVSDHVYGRVSNIGEPYAIVFDHGYAQNCKSGQHEIGHTYGLRHCNNSNCVIAQGSDPDWHMFEHLCNKHMNEWKNNKNKY